MASPRKSVRLLLPHHEARIASAWRDRRATLDQSLLYGHHFREVFDRIPMGAMVVIF